MDKIKDLYQDDLIYIFTRSQLRDLNTDYLAIIKNECSIQTINNCITMHYQDDFESLLAFSLPTKNRKNKQLISLNQCYKIMDKIHYGVLSFTHEGLPYSVALNHIIVDNRIFFHCAKSGYKLNSIEQRATYLIVEDLGINLKAGTHNHNSVAAFGPVHEVTEFETKKAALLKIVSHLAPEHPYNDKMVDTTNIIELEIDYINGKTHIR